MSFNKCYLTEERIRETYKLDGFDAIRRLFHIYDAYICDDEISNLIELFIKGDFSEEVLNIYLYEKVNNTETV